MKNTLTHFHHIIINCLFIALVLYLIIDINLISWHTSHIHTLKFFVISITFFFIIHNKRYLPIINKSRFGQLSLNETLLITRRLILSLNTLILSTLLGISWLLSGLLYNNNPGYFLGLFALFTIIFFGLQSLKANL